MTQVISSSILARNARTENIGEPPELKCCVAAVVRLCISACCVAALICFNGHRKISRQAADADVTQT